jgi:SPP1 family predicted phage head-tail adaptor
MIKCCDITPGALRHRINVQRQTYVADNAGGGVNTWGDYASIRAFIKPISGNERLYSMRLEANVTHRIFIRYRADLTTNDRINFNGRLMQIRALINLEEMNKFIEIYAEEGVAT